MTGVVEQTLDLADHSRHDGGVEQRVQTGEQECANDNGDQNFHAGVYIALSLFGGDSRLNGGDSGIELVADLLKHIFFLSFWD